MVRSPSVLWMFARLSRACKVKKQAPCQTSTCADRSRPCSGPIMGPITRVFVDRPLCARVRGVQGVRGAEGTSEIHGSACCDTSRPVLRRGSGSRGLGRLRGMLMTADTGCRTRATCYGVLLILCASCRMGVAQAAEISGRCREQARFQGVIRCLGLVVLMAAIATRANAANHKSENVLPVIEAEPIGNAASADIKPADALRAFHDARAWLSGWAVPTDETSPLPVGCRGASVQIRLGGELIGRGSAMDWPDTRTRGPNVLRRAMAEAILEADGRLDIRDDLFRDEAVRELAAQMTLSVELLGVPTPMLVETWLQAETDLQPGLDGVAARVGSRSSVVSASRMLSSNTLPNVALRRAVSEAMQDPSAALLEPSELRTKSGVRLFRFRGVHAAQTQPGGEPVLLERGNPVIRREISADSFDLVQRELVSHLVSRIRRAMEDGERPCGMYEPWSGRCGGPASASELAIAGIALARAARSLPSTGDDARTREDATHAAADVLILLADSEMYPDVGGDAISASGVVVLIATIADSAIAAAAGRRFDSVSAERVGVLRNKSLATLAKAYDDSTGFASSIPPGTKGFVALAIALADRAAMDVDETSAVAESAARARSLAPAAIRAIFRSTPTERLATEMPWLGWAELDVWVSASASGGSPAGADESRGAIPSAVALRSMRSALWAGQVGPFDVGADNRDVVGGLVFTVGSALLPSWHTARPAAFLASMLAQPTLTSSDERFVELARLLSAGQFLERLMLPSDGLWLAGNRSGDPALHGVRSATFDARQPIAATAFTLLAITELRSGIESLTTGPPSPQPAIPVAPATR